MERAQSLEGSDTVPSVENEGGEGEVFIPLSKTIDIGFPTGFSQCLNANVDGLRYLPSTFYYLLSIL